MNSIARSLNSTLPLRLVIAMMLAVLPTSMISAETPTPGSPVRKAILNVVRAEVDGGSLEGVDPKRYIEFLVRSLKTEGEWACFSGTPRYRDTGEKIDVAVTALLKKNAEGKWVLINTLYHGDVPGREELLRGQKVPESILPDWMR